MGDKRGVVPHPVNYLERRTAPRGAIWLLGGRGEQRIVMNPGSRRKLSYDVILPVDVPSQEPGCRIHEITKRIPRGHLVGFFFWVL